MISLAAKCVPLWQFILFCIVVFRFAIKYFYGFLRISCDEGIEPQDGGEWADQIKTLKQWNNWYYYSMSQNSPVVIKFFREFCQASKKIHSQFKKLALTHKGIFGDIDVENNELAEISKHALNGLAFSVYLPNKETETLELKYTTTGTDLKPLEQYLQKLRKKIK